jgi:predicted transcriptional regulator
MSRTSTPAPAHPTRLETVLKARDIKPAHLALECGYSRQHLLRIRMGRMDPTRRCIAAIVSAVRRLTRSAVTPMDLFELGDDLGSGGAPPARRQTVPARAMR